MASGVLISSAAVLGVVAATFLAAVGDVQRFPNTNKLVGYLGLDPMRQAERALAEQAELAYKRNIADWQATRPTKAGASATQGHASTEPSKG